MRRPPHLRLVAAHGEVDRCVYVGRAGTIFRVVVLFGGPPSRDFSTHREASLYARELSDRNGWRLRDGVVRLDPEREF